MLAIAFVVWQFMVWMPYFDGGYRLSVNRALLSTPDRERRHGLVRFAGDFSSWFAVAGLVVGMPAAWLYSLAPSARQAGLGDGFFLMVGLTGGCSMWMWSLFGVLTGVGRQARVYQLGCLNHLLNLTGLWLGFRCGLGPYAFPVSFLTGVSVCAPLAWWSIRRVEPALPMFRLRWDGEFAGQLREFRAGSMPALFFQVFALLLFSVDLPLVDLLVQDRRSSDAYAVSLRILTMVRLMLQSADEASWPLVAQDRERARALSAGLVRMNAWLYGIALGALVATLSPLIREFSAGRYSPSMLLVALLAGRVLIVGLASQPSYFLHGDGRFRELARYLGAELGLAAMLALVFAGRLGAAGVALAFLLSTVGGSLFRIPWEYARTTHQGVAGLMLGAWARAVVAFVVSGTAARLCLEAFPAGWVYHGVAGMAGGVAGMVVAGVWLWLRRRAGVAGDRSGWLGLA